MTLLRILFWFAASFAGLALLAFLAGYCSWQLALDREFEHSRATSELPLYPAERQGLVRVRARGMEFRTRIEGLNRGSPVVVLLHGFPETSIMWQPLLEQAGAAGMAVIAFDQRGYSPGARPETVAAYVVPELVADVFALADALGVDEFHLVGHDWGAAVAWSAAVSGDSRLASVTALSVPHFAAFAEAIREDPEQRRRSSYMALFRTPVLAELLFGVLDMRLLRFMHEVNRGEALDEYVRVFSEPGAMTAALSWYRAATIGSSGNDAGTRAPTVRVPALFIGGTRDAAVAPGSVEAQRKYIAGPFESHMRDAGHWLMGEDTDFVVRTIIEFVRRFDRPDQAEIEPPLSL